MIILDTNVLFGFLFAQDSTHEQCREILSNREGEVFYLIPEIWSELMTIIAVRFSSEKAIEVDQDLRQIQNLEFIEHSIPQNQIWKEIFCPLSPHRMSFADCTLLYLFQNKRAEILTLDKELLKYLKKTPKNL